MPSLEEALRILEWRAEPPSIDSLLGILQKCRKDRKLTHAKRLHAHICNSGLESHSAVGNYVVPLFVECGSVSDAQQVFNRLVHRNEHSWTSLILGYIESGKSLHALNLYQKMQEDRVHPSTYTLIALLRACARLKDVERGRQIHLDIRQMGFERNVFVGNTLVDMYAKCGSLAEAQVAFDKLPVQDVVSWTALIAGYAEHGHGKDALKCFDNMQLEGVSPNAVTFVCTLKACGNIRDISKGRAIHADIAQRGFGKYTFVGNSLLDMYAKCGSLTEAQEVFDNLPARDIVSWNALIAGYAEHGPGCEALKCFEQMQLEVVSPDAVTFVCILKTCGNTGAIDKGREIHADIVRNAFDGDVFVGNCLVDMYAKCGSVAEAQKVLDKLPVRDVVSWNALIAGYAEHGPGQDALKCFDQMRAESISPDAVTFVSVLKACGNIGAIDKGREIHAEIAQKGLERNVFVGNTLVDFYSKDGALAEAQEVFDKLTVRDVVSWTAIIAGYAEHGPGQEALKIFERMQLEAVPPDLVTYLCVLKACGNTGAVDKGRELHAEIAQKGFERDLSVGNSLIEMYCKCGSLSEAREVFDKLPVRDVMSWSAMIKGYGMNHECDMALQCFDDMQGQGVKPDDITFTSLLTACRASLKVKGHDFFNTMRGDYDVAPTIDHYTCMIDLLARSGHLYEAENLLEILPGAASEESWTALLSACKTYGEAEIGLRCFQQLVEMNPECASPYVLMAKTYASAGRLDAAYRMEEMRKCVGAWKKPASALIEVNKKVHEFVVGNNDSEEISSLLEFLNLRMKEGGHVPNVNQVLTPILDGEKEAALCEHAEKLAIAFGLLNTPQGQTLRVTKNLRMCNDCHNTSKILSRIERREIIVRDLYHVHHFRGGVCSCDDIF